MPFRSVKAVLYLGNVDDSNGAFNYAKGSNRFTFRRVIGEFLHSIKFYQARRNNGNLLAGLRKDLFDAEDIGPIRGRDNTMVIFDARGVHRRGDFKTDEARDTIWFEFREADSLMNRLEKLPLKPEALRRFAR